MECSIKATGFLDLKILNPPSKNPLNKSTTFFRKAGLNTIRAVPAITPIPNIINTIVLIDQPDDAT